MTSFVQTAGAGVDLARDHPGFGLDVRRARHARVEAANRAQDVDAAELLRVRRFLEEWRVHDGLLIRPGLPPLVCGRRVPCGRRDDLVVRYRAAVEHEVVSEVPASRAPEA